MNSVEECWARNACPNWFCFPLFASSTILAMWHHRSRGSHIPPPFFFFPVKELWLLCWWVIHITEADAQIPETSFYCCIKAVRARGDGLQKTSLEIKIYELGAKLRRFRLISTLKTLNTRLIVFPELFFLNSYNGPVFVLALITEVKLLIQPSDAHYVWTFGEFQFWENH